MTSETVYIGGSQAPHEIEVRPITVLFGMRSTDAPIVHPRHPIYQISRLPEKGLHPEEQAELGCRFARAAGEVGDQVIETTSHLLIMRIMRLVRDGVLTTDEVIMHHVNPKAAQITTLHVTDTGKFDKPVLDSFFDQDIEEIFGIRLTAEKVFGGAENLPE